MITPFICPKLRVSQNIECIRATQKESAIEQQQQHSRETVICQRHETILRLLSSAATASTRW